MLPLVVDQLQLALKFEYLGVGVENLVLKHLLLFSHMLLGVVQLGSQLTLPFFKFISGRECQG